VIYLYRDTLLPAAFISYDENGELIEPYRYQDYQINIGLTKHDFDPDNDTYNFSERASFRPGLRMVTDDMSSLLGAPSRTPRGIYGYVPFRGVNGGDGCCAYIHMNVQ